MIIVFSLLAGAALAIFLLTTASLRKDIQRPPGPPGRPIVGNLYDVSETKPSLRLKELSDRYGPVMRLNLARKEHLVLSTEKAANDLLRDKGSIYSSRPWQPAVADLLSGSLRPLFLPYNDRWRNGRRFMHHVTNPNVANSYQPSQSLESIRMLRDLLKDPSRYEHWFSRYSAGVIYRLAYGKAVITGKEKVVRDIDQVVENVGRVFGRDSYLVDKFPILMKLPKVIAPFKKELEDLHQVELNIFRGLMQSVQDDMDKGQAPKSWERDMIEQREKFRLSNDEGVYVVGTLFEAGAGTTAVAMMTWMLSIIHHLEWLSKMQGEIDAVCGPDRLPTLEDMPQLPIVRAVIKESMRWRPTFPRGVPHMSVKDDITSDGYFVPAGTTVTANNWAIHHDPELYPDPQSFNPSRWLDPAFPTYKEPLSTFPNLHNYSAFGFGRRICPGQSIAERSLYLLTSRVAWACDIHKAKDRNGYEITPPLDDFTGSLVVQPRPFLFELKARDQARADLIEAEYQRNQMNDPINEWE